MSVRTQKSIEVKGWNKFKTSIITYHIGLHLRSLNTYCMSQCVPLSLTHAAVSLIWMITCAIVDTWVSVFIWMEPLLEKTDAGRDWGQEEKGTTEDEMAGWHH